MTISLIPALRISLVHAAPFDSPWTSCSRPVSAGPNVVRITPGHPQGWSSVTCADCRAQASLAFNIFNATPTERNHINRVWTAVPAVNPTTR